MKRHLSPRPARRLESTVHLTTVRRTFDPADLSRWRPASREQEVLHCPSKPSQRCSAFAWPTWASSVRLKLVRSWLSAPRLAAPRSLPAPRLASRVDSPCFDAPIDRCLPNGQWPRRTPVRQTFDRGALPTLRPNR